MNYYLTKPWIWTLYSHSFLYTYHASISWKHKSQIHNKNCYILYSFHTLCTRSLGHFHTVRRDWLDSQYSNKLFYRKTGRILKEPCREIASVTSVYTKVLLLDGNSVHVTHAWKENWSFWRKNKLYLWQLSF